VRKRFWVTVELEFEDPSTLKEDIRKAVEKVMSDMEQRASEVFGTETSTSPIKIGDYWYPFMNEVARCNLGYGDDMATALERVKDWSVAIDGGSQVGRVANRLAEKFQRVYAIELSPANFACLKRNVVSNVTPVHGCLTKAGGGGFVAVPDKHKDSPVFRAEDGGNVPGVTIDELGLGSCGFIKLDLQGFDYFALLGAEQTLRRFKPPIYLEYDPSCFERYGINKHAHEIFLTGLGYEFLGTTDGNQTWA